jgi:regulator of protease activity HflC (stomatin/prohibitin superfamily)
MPTNSSQGGPPPLRVPQNFNVPGLAKYGIAGLLVFGALFFLPFWVWFFWRIEPVEGQIAVLIRKTGKNLPSGEIIATEPGRKGIQLDVLSEGRFFRNPYTWSWIIKPITDIPAGRLGVLTRLYGKDLPPGQILAQPGTKGVVGDVLSPGKHRVNPFAYSIEIVDATNIRPGSVGVKDSLVGEDTLDGNVAPEKRNTFTVEPGMKGVQVEVLDPGTHYLNPYVFSVVEVNLQSQRFQMSGEDAVSFLTADGFNVSVEGTIEFALMRDKAALLTHQIGDMDDILKKVILPRARGFSRIEGSKNPAINYIVGEMRQKFQDNLEAHLREQCKGWGVAIKSILVRNITVPDQIASIIRDREVAVQNAKMFDQQISQARSKAELVRQEMLAEQNKAKVQAETQQIQATILAEQERAVRVTAAEKDLSVAKLENEAADAQAAALVARAIGEQDAIRAGNEADAGVLKTQAAAFGTGMNYARHLFYQKVGPQIGSVLSSDKPDGLGALFLPFLPGKEGSR